MCGDNGNRLSLKYVRTCMGMSSNFFFFFIIISTRKKLYRNIVTPRPTLVFGNN